MTKQMTTLSKADKARIVFEAAYPDGKTTTMSRQDIISKIAIAADIPTATAASYFQNMKLKALKNS